MATRQIWPTMKNPLIRIILLNRYHLRRVDFFRKARRQSHHSPRRSPSEVLRLPSHSTVTLRIRNSRLPISITLSRLRSAAELNSLPSPRPRSHCSSQMDPGSLKSETMMNRSSDYPLENDMVLPKLSKENLQSSSSLPLQLAPLRLTTILYDRTSCRRPLRVIPHQLRLLSNSPRKPELPVDLLLS